MISECWWLVRPSISYCFFTTTLQPPCSTKQRRIYLKPFPMWDCKKRSREGRCLSVLRQTEGQQGTYATEQYWCPTLSPSQGLQAAQPCREAPQTPQQFVTMPGFAISASRKSCSLFFWPIKKQVSSTYTYLLMKCVYVSVYIYTHAQNLCWEVSAQRLMALPSVSWSCIMDRYGKQQPKNRIQIN